MQTCTAKSFRIRIYARAPIKSFRMRIYEKRGGGYLLWNPHNPVLA